MSDEEAPKTFRVARFKSLRALSEAADIPEDFDLHAYFGNAWAVYRGDETHDVELKFTKESAQVVTETIWHHTQRVTRHKDGNVTLQFQVDGLNEILHWILSWAGQVRVQRPEELKTLFIQSLENAIEMQAACGD